MSGTCHSKLLDPPDQELDNAEGSHRIYPLGYRQCLDNQSDHNDEREVAAGYPHLRHRPALHSCRELPLERSFGALEGYMIGIASGVTTGPDKEDTSPLCAASVNATIVTT